KNLGAMGDAGALVTHDADVARRARSLREHGQRQKYEHHEIGWTARLDSIQAAALTRKLPHLDGWNAARRGAAARYGELLAGVGALIRPPVASGSEPVWHVYVVQTTDPDGLKEHLASFGVSAGRHYPEPPHLSRAYAELGYPAEAFPVAETLGRQCLSLP